MLLRPSKKTAGCTAKAVKAIKHQWLQKESGLWASFCFFDSGVTSGLSIIFFGVWQGTSTLWLGWTSGWIRSCFFGSGDTASASRITPCFFGSGVKTFSFKSASTADFLVAKDFLVKSRCEKNLGFLTNKHNAFMKKHKLSSIKTLVLWFSSISKFALACATSASR